MYGGDGDDDDDDAINIVWINGKDIWGGGR